MRNGLSSHDAIPLVLTTSILAFRDHSFAHSNKVISVIHYKIYCYLQAEHVVNAAEHKEQFLERTSRSVGQPSHQ
jgi:hypothetical protein